MIMSRSPSAHPRSWPRTEGPAPDPPPSAHARWRSPPAAMTLSFTFSRSNDLLTAAQTLFLVIPLSSLWSMRTGAPLLLSTTHTVSRLSAIVAFALLVLMFALEEHGLGAVLCSTNLALRVLDMLRYCWLCARGARLRTKIQGDLVESLATESLDVKVADSSGCCWPVSRVW